MSDEIISLGNMLKELREKAGLTKLKTSALVECNQSYLSRIELEGRIPSLKLFNSLIIYLLSFMKFTEIGKILVK